MPLLAQEVAYKQGIFVSDFDLVMLQMFKIQLLSILLCKN